MAVLLAPGQVFCSPRGMRPPKKFLLEGIDRLGKDTLARGIQERLGYHLLLHYTKPLRLACYSPGVDAERQYQEASFRTLLQLLHDTYEAQVICNRSHLGEVVYAPLYRGHSGDYVFDLEREYDIQLVSCVRLILLTEDFGRSQHFTDDGLSLGDASKREKEQALFQAAFQRSVIRDKKVVCVTDHVNGQFRTSSAILDEALGP